MQLIALGAQHRLHLGDSFNIQARVAGRSADD